MADMHDVGHKIHGKLKQVQGDINMERGGTAGIKGGVQKIQGKIEETIADARLNQDKNKTMDENSDL